MPVWRGLVLLRGLELLWGGGNRRCIRAPLVERLALRERLRNVSFVELSFSLLLNLVGWDTHLIKSGELL